MKTVYLIEDNTVREIIPEYALPPEKWYSEAFARRCVEVQDDVEQGWRYNPETGQATPDTRPPEPKPPSAEKRLGLLEEALAQTDETAIALFESQAAQESINAQQDDALLDIYAMLGG